MLFPFLNIPGNADKNDWVQQGQTAQENLSTFTKSTVADDYQDPTHGLLLLSFGIDTFNSYVKRILPLTQVVSFEMKCLSDNLLSYSKKIYILVISDKHSVIIDVPYQ